MVLRYNISEFTTNNMICPDNNNSSKVANNSKSHSIESQVSNKRLAKNTIFLYARTLLTMGLNLYISRVVLETLGVEDYGIYNVVGGLVVMFSIVSASLTNSITRYMTFELGKGDDKDNLRRIFSTSFNIQLILSIIVVALVEIVGIWFLYYKMNIPPDRLTAANWVLQCSLVTFVLNLISLPYNASLISHERLDVYAYIGILEVSLKLIAVISINLWGGDNLIVYAVLIAFVALIIRMVYEIYCIRNFEECKYQFVLDKTKTKDMFSFAGWNFLGTSAYIFNSQGLDILSNLFFGVVVNASRGVATQASNAVKNFVNNFTTALNPQIIKSYAAGQYEYCFDTVMKGSKISYYLMLFIFVPFVLESNTILNLWLKEVPYDAALFFQLAMLGIIVDLPGAPLTILAQATGNIKKFYIWMGLLGCIPFPASYILFELGMPAYTAYIAYTVVYTYLVYVRLILMKKQVRFPIKAFLRQVILPILIVTLLSFIIPLFLHYHIENDIVRLIVILLTNSLLLVPIILLFGLKKSERKTIVSLIKRKINI